MIHVDFITFYFEADKHVSVILGCPFLATGGALIDLQTEKLKMTVHDEKRIFKVYRSLDTFSHCRDLCMIIEIVNDKFWVE